MDDSMLAAVILSGGASQRMGSPKALLPYRGKTFLEHLLEVSSHPRIRDRRVVLGSHADIIRAAIPLRDSEVVLNDEWEKGQLSSIHAALRSLPSGLDGMIVFLVDHPLISSALVENLVDRFDKAGTRLEEHSSDAVAGRAAPIAHTSTIVLPTYQGKRGHPVIFAASLFPELLGAPLEQGARTVVWAHATEVVEVPTTEQGCILNVNDPDALRKIQQS
jgi:molybdenum cofactor cytidylyltransferase